MPVSPAARLIVPAAVLAGLYAGLVVSPPVPGAAPVNVAAVATPPAESAVGRLQDLAGRTERLIADGRFQDALQAVTVLREAHPNDHVHLRQLAAVYRGLGRPAEEAAAWEQYMLVAPTPQNACPAAGQAYERAGDGAKALDILQRCRALDPTDADLTYFLARAEARWGSRERARTLYEAGLKLDPRYADMAVALGRVYLAEQRLPDATRMAALAETNAPDNPDVLLFAGQVYLRGGRRAAARTSLERAVALQDDYADLHLVLGMVYDEDGRRADAAREYERARALAPDREDIRARIDMFMRRSR